MFVKLTTANFLKIHWSHPKNKFFRKTPPLSYKTYTSSFFSQYFVNYNKMMIENTLHWQNLES